jgi:hypothetical protein
VQVLFIYRACHHKDFPSFTGGSLKNSAFYFCEIYFGPSSMEKSWENRMPHNADDLLRIYCHEDRSDWPRDWPDAIGVICLWKKGSIVGVSPFHSNENRNHVISRAIKTLRIKSGSVSCYPSAPGLTVAPLDMKDDLEISDALTAYLKTNPDITEWIHDFILNYEFAASEGLVLEDFAEEELREAIEPVDHPLALGDCPHGYLKFDPDMKTVDVFTEAFVRLGEEGQVDLVLPRIDSAEIITEIDVFIREDGLGFALSVEQILENEVPPGVIVLPEGCLDLAAPKKGELIDVRIVQGEDYLFVTPYPWTKSRPAPVQNLVKRPSYIRKLINGLLTVVLLLFLSLVAMHVFGDDAWVETQEEALPSAPTDTLKDLVFGSEND